MLPRIYNILHVPSMVRFQDSRGHIGFGLKIQESILYKIGFEYHKKNIVYSYMMIQAGLFGGVPYISQSPYLRIQTIHSYICERAIIFSHSLVHYRSKQSKREWVLLSRKFGRTNSLDAQPPFQPSELLIQITVFIKLIFRITTFVSQGAST